MIKQNKPDCRPQHCENHNMSWAIAGTIFAITLVGYAIHYFGSTPQQFPPIKEEIKRQYQTQSNETCNLLEDPRTTNILKRLRSSNSQ